MIRIIGFAALLVISLNSSAEWIQVGYSDSSYSYVDLDSKKAKGDVIEVLTLVDEKMPDYEFQGKYIFLSRKLVNELDCENKRLRILSTIRYSGGMGKGEVVDSYSGPSQWEKISDGSIGNDLLKLVCIEVGLISSN